MCNHGHPDDSPAVPCPIVHLRGAGHSLVVDLRSPQTARSRQDCVVDRCPGDPLRTTVLLVPPGRDEETVMTVHYPNPALEAELAYRRERIEQAFATGSRRGSWTSRRRRTR